MATNLYDQMTELSRSTLAQMLGFAYAGEKDMRAVGFRIALREIPALPSDSFTMGQALDAYLAHLAACRAASAPATPTACAYHEKPCELRCMGQAGGECAPAGDARIRDAQERATAQMDADWKLPETTRSQA
ncbi:hypothetical protein [Paraburkholderia hospita]|uniref:hypothetical protein n=1 Tax=Paraburkholderia hospita TaxID=169430 RepID=UPI0008A7A7F8|nr:hypothetical protein [Paraburkholderia hospita]SEH89441.1 hypothetical protein SAMN05192544_1011124 [Paraburkholderia hospita]